MSKIDLAVEIALIVASIATAFVVPSYILKTTWLLVAGMRVIVVLNKIQDDDHMRFT